MDSLYVGTGCDQGDLLKDLGLNSCHLAIVGVMAKNHGPVGFVIGRYLIGDENLSHDTNNG